MRLVFSILFITLFVGNVFAQIELPKLVSDGMVLQRDATVIVWGWSSPEENITVSFKNKNYKTKADKEGNWELKLEDLKPGGPFQMTLSGKNEINLQDIYIGDVWLCSGQSNMEISMFRVAPLYEEEIASANNPAIRYFEVPKEYDLSKERTKLSGGSWKAVNRENIEDFSAVSYFFGKNLNERYKVPIGLINSALGGSPVQSWLSKDALNKYPEYLAEVERLSPEGVIDSLEQIDQTRIQAWYADVNSRDTGLEEIWSSEELDDSNWQILNMPDYWSNSNLGSVNGIVWLRKSFQLDASTENKSAKLILGRIVDADSVFVNGQFVGNTTYQYPPRRYEIPEDLLKSGKNVISVKVLNERGDGGFVNDKPYQLVIEDEVIDLKGPWKYKLGAAAKPLEPQTFYRWKPEGLYNAMINPLLKYNIKGVIWYQGESNTSNPDAYNAMFSNMIVDWRSKWNQQPEDFPFLFVQLTNFMTANREPTDSNWARLREAQMETLSVPETGMAVTIDIGEWNDIHPLNKKDVGNRLAQAAANVAYNEDVLPGGPLMEDYEIHDGSISISFDNVGKGLMIKNGKDLEEFAIAGEDGKFVWADAKIVGDKVVVSSPKVKNPVAVRYAWADNPDKANLYNKKGLPASPFRTDDW